MRGIANKGVRCGVAVVLAAAGFGLAACGGTESPGTAVPAVTTTSATPSETGGETTGATATSSAKAESLADTDPCDLLTEDDKASLGVTKSEGPEEFATARICRVRTPAGTLTPGIWDSAGFAQVVATGPIGDVKVGSREAKLMRNTATGGCVVILGVTASSRVDVLAGDRQGNQDEACDLALRAAKLIEPNLPES